MSLDYTHIWYRSETLVPSCQFFFFYILIYFTDTGYTSLKNILIFLKTHKKSLFYYRQATLYSIHMTKKNLFNMSRISNLF